MVVYIEVVICNNLIADMCLMVLTTYILRLPTRAWRILLSGAIGTAVGVLLPWLQGWWSVIVKLCFLLAMTLPAAKYANIRQYLAACAVFTCFTVATGGLWIGVANLSGTPLTRWTQQSILPALVSVACVVVWIVTHVVYRRVLQVRRDQRYACRLTLVCKDISVQCVAYRDSGNKLYYHERPVMILDPAIARRFYPDRDAHTIHRTVRVDTVAGTRELPLLCLDRVIVEGQDSMRMCDVWAAISDTPLRRYGALLHCDM